jgi:predicted esterase
MIKKWIIVEPTGNPKGCLLALPGRNIPADAMEGFCHHTGLNKSLLICLEPENYQWYIAPNGPHNQTGAVNGLKDAVQQVELAVQKIERDWSMPRGKIGILGFSAGSVLAIQLAAVSRQPFAGIVSLAGAILEPDKLPPAPNKTPILLQHNQDDDCFKWDERYLPMKKVLIDRGYNVFVCERDEGGHSVCMADANLIEKFLGPYLGYGEKKKLDTTITTTTNLPKHGAD